MENLARIGFMCGVALLEPMHPTMVFIWSNIQAQKLWKTYALLDPQKRKVNQQICLP
jgi:hypothetical protein